MTIKGIYFIIIPILLFLIYLGINELIEYISTIPKEKRFDELFSMSMFFIVIYFLIMIVECEINDSENLILAKPFEWFVKALVLFSVVLAFIVKYIVLGITNTINFINKHLTVKI